MGQSGKPAHHLAPGDAATARSCYRIALALLELNLTERGKDGAPKKVLLDFDATDDPTHAQQEQSYYHGYYMKSISTTLWSFSTAIPRTADHGDGLRAGNTHASRGALAILKRIVRRVREAWPEAEIEIRADAGFALPEIYEYCEEEGIGYAIGLISNPRLEDLAEDLLERARRR